MCAGGRRPSRLARPLDPVILRQAHADQVLGEVLRPVAVDVEEPGRLGVILPGSGLERPPLVFAACWISRPDPGCVTLLFVSTPMDLNREHWDEATDIHARGNVYGIEDFKAGRCQLHRIEVEELGDVAGKTLLHLQCHFGLGTLSWARRGAIVTGVDFSPKAIALARSLATEAGSTRGSSSPTSMTCRPRYRDDSTSSSPPTACSAGFPT